MGAAGSQASASMTVAGQNAAAEAGRQYSLGRILGIWALAAMPMGVLSWVVFPALSTGADPLGAGVTRILVLTVGLAWLCALTMIIVRQEEGDLRWATIKHRLRLGTPRDPGTGETRKSLWLWAVPMLVVIVVYELLIRRHVGNLWVTAFPFLAEPAGWGMAAVLQSEDVIAGLKGAWWFLALYVVQAAFNTFLGEELLFRGVLLPRMEGVFGKWSWAANGVLHGVYHLHQPWGIAPSVVSGVIYAFPSWRLRTTWMGVIAHSAQSVYFAFLILGVVLGLA